MSNGSRQKSILQLFNSIANIVCEQLEDLGSASTRDEDNAYVTAKDFMNDFATEEFLTKNIRVRPQSGITGKDVDEKQSEHISRNNLIVNALADPTDDEEKFNRMVNLEMDEQRKKLKQHREELERKKIMEAEKLAKAKEKKK